MSVIQTEFPYKQAKFQIYSRENHFPGTLYYGTVHFKKQEKKRRQYVIRKGRYISVEALHRQFRKVTKSKTIFPNSLSRFVGNKALEKMLFLAYFDLSQKWTTTIRDWTKIISQLAIAFEGRLNLNL